MYLFNLTKFVGTNALWQDLGCTFFSDSFKRYM